MIADSPLVDRVAPSPNFGDRRGRTIDSIVLHYTGMSGGESALERLTDPASEVSCHYLVWEDGRVDQLVAEHDRAWHAGRSFWSGERDINAVSIGIEIVNAGHDDGCPAYPDAQIAAVVALCLDCRARRAIARSRVLAHSDVAPDRKIDPGEHFPWATLAAAGACLFVPPAAIEIGPVLALGAGGTDVASLRDDLARLGFDPPPDDAYDPAMARIVAAFQRRHRPALVDGRADLSTRLTLRSLLQATDQIGDANPGDRS